MAGAELKKGTEAWMMYADFWKLLKDYWIPEENDNYWNELVNAANEFAEKYKYAIPGNLSVKLAIAFCEAKDIELKTK